ncbi:hypothetical protein MMM100_03490 [Helicobacter pylori]
MAEWKTDTEEVKQIVKACMDFKRSLQEEKCTQFIKDLDAYAREILLERKKIEHQLQGAREELKKAKSNEKGARLVLRGLQFASGISLIWPPARAAAALAVAAAPEEVRFNGLRLAEFESVFSVIVPLEDLDKTACAHHALKALEAALKNRDLGFDATELEQIAKGFIPKGYLWHFDANVLGNVALVREELLLGVKHTKGYKLWEKFLQTQN